MEHSDCYACLVLLLGTVTVPSVLSSHPLPKNVKIKTLKKLFACSFVRL
jgi:hypothetical protein